MNHHETPRDSQSETGRPGSYGHATEDRYQSRSAPAFEGVRADQREATKVLAHSRSRLRDDISQYVRNRPLPALAIAAGVGFLIGRRGMPRRSAGTLPDEAGVHWPPRLQSPRSRELEVQFPPRQS